ncbi:TPA: phage tail protein [Streptococcus suis]|nr:phage tail protein [Streptococcus suis]
MIYLFDKDEKLIKIVRKSAVKTALQKYALTTERYVSDRLTVELKGLNADELEQVEYMAIQTMEDAHTFHYFYVAQKFSDELTTLIGVQSGIEELRKSPIYDKRPKNALARDVIADLLAGTNWQARFVGETTPHSTNFYYTSVFDALKKVCEVWDLEMQFFVEMNGNRVGGRYIDFKRRIGEAVGKRVVYGHNALQILQEVERTNIFTALIGRGKGEETGDGYGRKITFENVVWSRTQGKPVDKPKGQKYLELPLMTRQYGIKNADGSMRPKIGFVDFSEEENPEILIERTYKALVNAARPQLTLKTSSVYLRGVKVGDAIRVVRHDKKLDYDTRIFEITFNRLNNQSSDIKLGDRIGESNEAKVQTIADKAVEQFITNEFSTFVQNLPNHLPSADGFNNNWYGAEDPTVQYPGKVLINDIWFKPDPEHEGHQIMLRWTGEVWEEILRTYESESLRERIAEEIAQVNQSMQAQSEEHDRQVADILSKTQSVEELANQAKTDAASAIQRSSQLKAEAVAEANRLVQAQSTALTERIQSVDVRVDDVANQVSSKVSQIDFDAVKKTVESNSTAITQNQSAIELKADKTVTDALAILVNQTKSELKITSDAVATKVSKTDFDATNQRLTTAETTIRTQAGQIEQRLTHTQLEEALGSKDYVVSSTMSNLIEESTRGTRQLITQVESKIPTKIGARNLLRNGDFSQGIAYWESNSGSPDVTINTTTDLKNKVGRKGALWLSSNRVIPNGQGVYQRISGVQLTAGDKLTFSFDIAGHNNNASLLIIANGENFDARTTVSPYQIPNITNDFNKTSLRRLQVTLDVRVDVTAFNFIVVFADGTFGNVVMSNLMLETGPVASDFSYHESELVTSTKFHEITDRVDSHARTIGDQGNAISQIVQTANGIISRVDKISVGGTNLLRNTKDYSGDWSYNGNRRTLAPWQYKGLSALAVNHEWDGLSQLVEVKAGEVYTFSAYVASSSGNDTAHVFIVLHGNRSEPKATIDIPQKSYRIDSNFKQVSHTFQVLQDGYIAPRFERSDTSATLYVAGLKLERGSIPTDYSPAPEDGDQAIQAVSTQVSQLAGSWAVQNLTNSGTVLNQLNLNKDGSVKIDGSLVQITGKTYIENGVIKEAMIGKGQIGTAHIGEIDAGIAKIINLDVSNIKGLDAEFIKAKIENAFIEWMKGKTITAQNEAMTIGLNDAFIRFKDNAKIEFQSEDNTLYRTKNGTSAFIHFRDDSYNGVYTAMGVNADNTGTQNDYSSGSFAGVRVIRSNPSRYSGTTVDQVQLVGDEIRIRHGYGYENDYLVIKWDNQGKIDLIKFLRSVASKLGLPLT